MVHNEKNQALQFTKHFYAQYLLHCNIEEKIMSKRCQLFWKMFHKIKPKIRCSSFACVRWIFSGEERYMERLSDEFQPWL